MNIIKRITGHIASIVEDYRQIGQEQLWIELSRQLAQLLRDYKLCVACSSGEAYSMLFHYLIKKVVNDLTQTYPSHNSKPRLVMVSGPILSLSSEYDGKSIVIDLLEEGLLELFYSDYRQAKHFRIGGWEYDKFFKDGNSPNKMICKEKQHILGASPKQRRSEKITENGENKSFGEYCSLFKSFIDGENKHITPISTKKMLLKKFILLDNDQINKVKDYVKSHYEKDKDYFDGKSPYGVDNEKKMSREYYLTALEKLKITPHNSNYIERNGNKNV